MIPRTPLPDQKTLKKLFRYDRKTGKLFWRKRPRKAFKSEQNYQRWMTMFCDKECFKTPDGGGYLQGMIGKQTYRAHRVIWKIVYGTEPEEIEHDDRNRRNNRLKNLKEVSHAENMKNKNLNRNNISGFSGVYFDKSKGKWRAQICLPDGRRKCRIYPDKESAISARAAAELEFNYHPSHGK